MTEESLCSFCHQPLSQTHAYFPGLDSKICDTCDFEFAEALGVNVIPLRKVENANRKVIAMERWKIRKRNT